MPIKDTFDSRVKVLRVATRLNVGGPSHHIYFLSSLLNQDKFQTLLAYGSVSRGEKQYPLLPQTSRCILISSLTRNIHPLKDLTAFLKLFWLILSEKPQIVHTHMAKAGTLARLAAWICRVPIVVHTYHGHIFDGYFSSRKTKMFIRLERFLGRRTDCIVVMGKEIAHELTEKYQVVSAEKIQIFYPGLDLAPYLENYQYRRCLRKELGLGGEEILVALIGRLSPVKRPQFFVQIAKKILQQNRNFRFLIVGGGEEEKRVINLIKEKELDKEILFLGWRSDLAVIYSDVDIVVQCSSDEGTPNVLIEALASAKPVVASRVGAIPEIVEHGRSGFLLDKEDEEGFVTSLLLLADHPNLRYEMGLYGREFVRNRFSKEHLICRSEELYLQLLSSQKKP